MRKMALWTKYEFKTYLSWVSIIIILSNFSGKAQSSYWKATVMKWSKIGRRQWNASWKRSNLIYFVTRHCKHWSSLIWSQKNKVLAFFWLIANHCFYFVGTETHLLSILTLDESKSKENVGNFMKKIYLTEIKKDFSTFEKCKDKTIVQEVLPLSADMRVVEAEQFYNDFQFKKCYEIVSK